MNKKDIREIEWLDDNSQQTKPLNDDETSSRLKNLVQQEKDKTADNIQKVREELEDKSEDSKLRGMNINPYKFKLEGFNLGVSVTQKEFLRYLRDYPNAYSIGDKIHELKKSLGVDD